MVVVHKIRRRTVCPKEVREDEAERWRGVLVAGGRGQHEGDEVVGPVSFSRVKRVVGRRPVVCLDEDGRRCELALDVGEVVRDGERDGVRRSRRPRLADLVDGGENRCECDAKTRSSDEDDDDGESENSDDSKRNQHVDFFFEEKIRKKENNSTCLKFSFDC